MALKLADKHKISAAIAISFAFFVCELGVAFKTGSLALMADAFHYLNDLVGFIVTLMSIVISEKPQYRQDFSFGWQRARLLGAFFNGAFLLALGISIFFQSVERFISVRKVEDVKLILIMGCVGLGLNILTALFLHDHHGHHHHHSDPESETSSGLEESSGMLCVHQDHDQLTCPFKEVFAQAIDSHAHHRHAQRSLQAPGRDLGMMGALLHVVGDAINNVGVIIAAVIIWFISSPARFYADPAVGMAISLMILLSALPLVRHSGEILLQSAPQGVNLDDIKHDIEKIPGIESVHELHVWRLDQHKAIASAHVAVSDPDVAGFMARARTIRECLHAYGIHSTTLQPELTNGATMPITVAIGPEHSSTATVAAQTTPGLRDGAAVGGGDGRGGGDAAGRGERLAPCQLMCGRGMCDHLMCCNMLIQV